MLTFLIHADRPPEFKDLPRAARYKFPQEDFSALTYESLGKVVVAVSDEDEEPTVCAECRMFAHPDLIAEIRENGEQRVIAADPANG